MTDPKLDSYALHVKHRPTDFDQFAGNQTLVENLQNLLQREKGIPHSFLFTGPKGCGKTTLAYITASKLDSPDPDYLNAANNRGIDTVRQVIQEVYYKPRVGSARFIIFDECHMMNDFAQNALLNLLEKPPAHAYFALCTTNPEKLLDTIVDRCTRFEVKELPSQQIVKLLKEICAKEKVEFPPSVLREIARNSGGSCRGALKLLDQVLEEPDDNKVLDIIKQTVVSEASLRGICQLLVEQKAGKWEEMSKYIKAMDDNQEGMRIGIINYLTTVILNRPSGDDRLIEMLSIFLENTYDSGKKGGIVYQLYLACKL